MIRAPGTPGSGAGAPRVPARMNTSGTTTRWASGPCGTALAVQTLREDRDDDTEFVTISYWPDVESMARFTGRDPRAVHHLPRDAEFLIELPRDIQILELRSAHGLEGIAPRTLPEGPVAP